MGCSTPPAAVDECKTDEDCNAGQECQQGVCLEQGERICTTVTDCAPWEPTGGLGPCEEKACTDQRCATVPLAADQLCAPTDAETCKTYACDGAGACIETGLSADTCYIDGACASLGEKQAGSGGCMECNPQSSTEAWVPSPNGAACDPDSLDCTLDQCDGSGSCAHDNVQAGFCLIGGTCESAGAALEGGCQTCDPSSDQRGWTLASEGATCTTPGAECLEQACSATGTCEVGAVQSGKCAIETTPSGGGDAVVTCFDPDEPNPDNTCETCQPSKSQTAWSELAVGETCLPTEKTCVRFVCGDAGGALTCTATPDATLCDKASGPCQENACDASVGCSAASLPTTVTCDADDLPCTEDACDGNGACAALGSVDDSLCDDANSCTADACEPLLGTADAQGCTHTATPDVACADDGVPCTLDTCSQDGACVATPQHAECDDGNECTANACNPGDAGADSKGCTLLFSTGEACTDDGLACTTDTCDDAGSCAHAPKSGTCAIDGSCYNDQDPNPAANGCQVCDAGVASDAWTNAAENTPCDDDGAGCTTDLCDAAGVCQHAGVDSLCDDNVACTFDACDPGSGVADAQTGCTNIDKCPWGHACDVAKQACLTSQPLILADASADDPAPTNPAVIRHVLDADKGLMRTWVLYQSDTCATASAGAWTIGAPGADPVRLRAVVLDDQIAAPADKTPPVTVTLDAGGWPGGAAYCQAFPVVAADPDAPGQAWVSWLEADAGNAAAGCLANDAQGGVLRLGKLDGSAVSDGAAWSAVAGSQCTEELGVGPLMHAGGLAMLSAGTNASAANATALFARGFGFNFSVPSGSMSLMAGTSSSAAATTANALEGNFSAVPPVLVDTGAVDQDGARFWALALTEDGADRQLWALPLDAAGEKKPPAAWLDSTSGVGATVLGGVSAVCGLDAAYDPISGEMAVVVSTRLTGGQFDLDDRLELVIFGANGVKQTASIVANGTTATEDACHYGVTSARLARGEGGWHVSYYAPASAQSSGVPKLAFVADGGAPASSNLPMPPAAGTDADSAMSTPPLAWRGLGDIVVGADGAAMVTVEGKQGAKRVISVLTIK